MISTRKTSLWTDGLNLKPRFGHPSFTSVKHFFAALSGHTPEAIATPNALTNRLLAQNENLPSGGSQSVCGSGNPNTLKSSLASLSTAMCANLPVPLGGGRSVSNSHVCSCNRFVRDSRLPAFFKFLHGVTPIIVQDLCIRLISIVAIRRSITCSCGLPCGGQPTRINKIQALWNRPL